MLSIKRTIQRNKKNNLLKSYARWKEEKKMRKRNSSSEFAFNMPALERRRSDAAHFIPARRRLVLWYLRCIPS